MDPEGTGTGPVVKDGGGAPISVTTNLIVKCDVNTGETKRPRETVTVQQIQSEALASESSKGPSQLRGDCITY